MTITREQIRVKSLEPGMMVDLEGDRFAAENMIQHVAEFEFFVISDTTFETPNCTRVDFEDGTSIGFPPDHQLAVAGRVPA